MMRFLIFIPFSALAACSLTTPPEDAPPTSAPSVAARPGADPAPVDPLDTLRNRWEVARIDDVTFPDKQAFVHFQQDGFFSHEAGCGGGHPAFYDAKPDGTLSTSRREAVVIGKCINARAAILERVLADFVDRADGWNMPEPGRLVLTSSDGKTAHLRLPVGPVPELEGGWRVVSIGGRNWSGPKPATVSVGFNWFGAGAGCNGGGATWSSPGPGRLAIGPFSSTEMLCEEPLMRAEGELFGAVAAVTGYRIDGNRAVLTGKRDIVLQR